MQKIDYKKEFKAQYKPSAKKVAEVEVPKWNYLMIDGEGDPNTVPMFQQAIETLYPVSYTLKFTIKRGETALDYAVMPLEGLWWADDMTAFDADHKDDWKWTLMIMQPDFVTGEQVAAAIEQVRKKKAPPLLSEMRFEAMDEGRAAQIMHIGPFSEERPAIEKVHQYIAGQGGKLSGKHHEIYLSDMRRAAPEKWKTVIRQPFVPV